MHAIATCPLGFETVAAQEMLERGFEIAGVHADEGLVEWETDEAGLARAHHELRTVERIALTAGEFRARGFAELRRKIARLPWERWIDAQTRVHLRVTSRGSRLYHERAIAERAVQGIGDRLDRPVEVAAASAVEDDGDPHVQRLVIRIERDLCAVRVDASGARLHRRGYRLATAKAPLRATLAAALLRYAGVGPDESLIDPFCGSGTILIEAAAARAGGYPGLAPRSYRFQRWPGMRDVPGPAASPVDAAPETIRLLGGDRHDFAIDAARSNAERAGLREWMDLEVCDVADLDPRDLPPGWVVTNPPYGRRSAREEGEVEAIHARFGRWARTHLRGWRLVMLCADPVHARATGLDWVAGPWIRNGGIRVRVLRTQ